MSDPVVASLLEIAADVVQRARKRGADVAEAVARSGSELSVKVRLGEVEVVEEAGHRSLGMRILKGGKVALTSTSDLTPEGIDRFLSDALELATLSQEDPFAGPADPSLLLRGALPELDLFDAKMGDLSAKEAIVLAERAEKAATSFDPRIDNSDGATFSRTAGAVGMVLSSGFSGGYRGSFASIAAVPLASDAGGKKRRGYYYSAKRHLSELQDPEEIGREAARRTLRKLGARKVPTCAVPVVFDPDAARSIVGTFAGCSMGSSLWRKSSYLLNREGTQVANSMVSIIDDPHIARAPGSRPYDGEGLPGRTNIVVEAGTFRTALCDSYSARKLGRATTASASRGGSGGVGVSTSNFIMQAGTTQEADVIRSTRRGLYVTEMMGFGFNAITGDFSRGASGFWIEDGVFAFPVSEVTISSNLDTMLKGIDLIGNELDWRSSVVAPMFRVSEMTLAGT